MSEHVKKLCLALYHKISLPLLAAWLLALLFFAAFSFLSEGVMNDELNQFDQVTGEFVRGLGGQGITELAIWATRLGDGVTETILCVLFAALFIFGLKRKWSGIFLSISLAGGWLLNVALKLLFQRQRPTIEHVVQVGGYSFPSGHAMVSTIFYGMLGYIIWSELNHRDKSRWFISPITVLLIFSIGASRVYLGVHFPSDVIAGFSAGGLWLMACIWGLRTLHHRTNKNLTITSEQKTT